MITKKFVFFTYIPGSAIAHRGRFAD